MFKTEITFLPVNNSLTLTIRRGGWNLPHKFHLYLITLVFRVWLRVSTKVIDFYQSFNMLHMSCKRALPEMFMKYKLALCLYKLYNESFNSIEFAQLNFNQVLTGRQENFKIIRNNVYKVGLNSLSNRLHFINDQIPLNWLNCSFGTYKIRCKSLFLSF